MVRLVHSKNERGNIMFNRKNKVAYIKTNKGDNAEQFNVFENNTPKKLSFEEWVNKVLSELVNKGYHIEKITYAQITKKGWF